MRVTRFAIAAVVLSAALACQAGDPTLTSLSGNSTQRVARVGHAKLIAPFRGPAGLSLALAAPTNGIAVQDMTNGITAAALAQALVGPGVSISNVTYTGAAGAAGIFAADPAVLGVPGGIILSTGSAKSVIGPNQFDDVTTDWSGAGDSQLSALVGNNQTFDASILQFDFVPDSSTIYIAAYVFGSDEYNEFVNSDFNDAMAFFVNGTNCALIGGQPVSVNAINNGFPYNTDPRSNPDYYRNNSLTDGGGSINTELDGLTRVLTCTGAVNKGKTNHVKLAIADVFDGLFDSDVFIGTGALTTIPPKPIPVPHAVATFSMAPDCSRAGALVTLDGSGSSEPGGSIVNYQWYYGTSAAGGQLYATGKVATLHFDPLGVWPMTLVVTDASGNTAHTTFSFTVNPTPAAVDSLKVSPFSLSPVNGQYTKMAVSGKSVGACPDSLSVTVTSSQVDLSSSAGDQAADIRVVHHDGSVAVSSNAQASVTFNPALDTLYLRAETSDTCIDRTYSLSMTANGAAKDSTKVLVRHTGGGSGLWAIFATGKVTMSGNATTDSYNSAKGAYRANAHDSLGSVASVGSMSFSGNVRIEGNATSNGTIPTGKYVTGISTQHAAAFPPMLVDPCPLAYTPASAVSGSKYSYNANTGTLSASGQGSIVLNGPGPFYFASVSLSGQATFSVSNPGGQHVDVYISGALSSSGGGITNGMQQPSALAIRACGNPSKPAGWNLSGNASSYFTLYAPNHDVVLSGNGAIFGSIVANDFTASGNAQVHADEAGSSACAGGGGSDSNGHG